jgi:hypothetical protein
VIFAFCTEGEAGGELTTCVDDAVCETEACPDGNSCKDETECGECLNYEEKCRESDSEWGVYQCRSGQWTYLKACDHTITCENGDDGKGLITECLGKECEIVEECSGSCNRNGTACGECHNSFKVCSDENTGGKPIGYVYLCQSGVMTHYSTCTNNICKNWYQCP